MGVVEMMVIDTGVVIMTETMIIIENVIETGIVTETATETVMREIMAKTYTGAGTGVETVSGWITWTYNLLQSLSLPLSLPQPHLQLLPPNQ